MNYCYELLDYFLLTNIYYIVHDDYFFFLKKKQILGGFYFLARGGDSGRKEPFQKNLRIDFQLSIGPMIALFDLEWTLYPFTEETHL